MFLDHQFVGHHYTPFLVYSVCLSLDTVNIEALRCETVLSIAGLCVRQS